MALHEECFSAVPIVRGVYNIVGPGEVPLSQILRELGRSPIPIPHFAARPLLRTLFRYGVIDFPPGDLDFLGHRRPSLPAARWIRTTAATVFPAPLPPAYRRSGPSERDRDGVDGRGRGYA